MRALHLSLAIGKALVWLLSIPVLFTTNAVKLWAVRPMMGDAVPCRTCGTEIALLGLWQCPCGYNFYGWYFSRCEVCGEIPPFIDCPQCGASTMNPLLFG